MANVAQKKPEQLFRDYWREFLLQHITDLQWVESPSSSGIPDCSISIDGVESWVELKVTDMPKRHDTPLNLRHFTVEQENWLVKRGKSGSPVFLALRVRCGETGGYYHLLVHGSKVGELRGKDLNKAIDLAALAWWAEDDYRVLYDILDALQGRLK